MPDLYDLIHAEERAAATAAAESPPHNGTATSADAAEQIAPLASELRRRVYDAVAQSRDGLTREEIGDVTGIEGNTVRPRVWELIHEGRLVDTAARRRGRSGRRASVVRVVG